MHNHDHDADAHSLIAEDPELSFYAKRAAAIEALLIEKGMVTADNIRRRIEIMDSRTPAVGAQVVAKAWVDPDFRTRLLANAKAAVAELDIEVESPNLVAVENTVGIHNVIVCTLCSCYPTVLLGASPGWYKSLEYRARVVVDARGVLREFGLELDEEVEVRVYDSTAEMRYIVIPQRPDGTEHMSEEELAALITRDSMIGVARARTPAGEMES